MTAANADRDTTVDMRALRPGRQLVDADALGYATTHTTDPSTEVAALHTDTAMKLPVPGLAAGVVEARLLEALVVATRASRVLDVGTFTGVSALSIAARLPAGGRVTTVEREEQPAAIARQHFDRSQHRDKIESILGDAREVIDSIDGPFELVFLDAWKKDYWSYYEAVLPKLAPHGIIVADNVLWRGLAIDPPADDVEAVGIRAFADKVQRDPRVDNALLTVGDGLLLIWRRDSDS